MPDLPSLGRSANQVADWLELVALTRPGSVGSDALLLLGRQNGLGESDIGLGLTTMTRRASQLGARYPFRIANGIATRPGAHILPWTSLLLLSPGSPARAHLPLGEAAVHLEQLTAGAMGSFFGPATEVARFGWPGDAGRPPEFPDAVRWLAGLMQADIGAAYRPPFRKDGGVDVVAWRPFVDGRSGFPVVLVQCTLEQDYAHKATDVDLRVWAGWLRLDIDPMTALAVPTVVPHGESWNALAARTVILDRPRLCGLIDDDTDPVRLGRVQTWTQTALAALQDEA